MFKGKWTEKLTNVLVWVSGYVSFLAFGLIGGYILIKGNDNQKLTSKRVFIVVLMFLAATAVMEVFYNFASLSDNYYGSFAQDFYVIVSKIIEIVRIGVFATFAVLELINKKNSAIEPTNNNGEQSKEEK